jgi:adhesin transport system outer membrane protein
MKSKTAFAFGIAPALRSTALVMMLGMHSGQVFAQELADAVRAGLAIHPEVRAVMADRERASTEVEMARSGYHPALSLSAGPQEFNFGDVVYDATVSQMLYDWGRVRSKVDRA